MDMKQILLFGLLLVPVWTCKMSRCYDEDKVSEAAERKLRTRYPRPTEPPVPAAADSSAGCPVALYQQHQQWQTSLHARSLSPWEYVNVTKEDHFPSTYAEARCLCSGCILIQHKNHGGPPVKESHDYNSVPIIQSRLFLKREPCDDKNGKTTYRLKPVTVKVAVGCTCARANTSS